MAVDKKTEKVTYRLVLELNHRADKGDTPEIIAKRARCKLEFDKYGDAQADCVTLSEAGGVAKVNIWKITHKILENNQSGWYNGKMVERFGQPHMSTTRKERREQEKNT